MSVGYGGYCVKYGEKAEYVLYEYYAFDLNVPGFHNDKRQMDGLIKIDKTTFIEPEIYTRINADRDTEKEPRFENDDEIISVFTEYGQKKEQIKRLRRELMILQG